MSESLIIFSTYKHRPLNATRKRRPFYRTNSCMYEQKTGLPPTCRTPGGILLFSVKMTSVLETENRSFVDTEKQA